MKQTYYKTNRCKNDVMRNRFSVKRMFDDETDTLYNIIWALQILGTQY